MSDTQSQLPASVLTAIDEIGSSIVVALPGAVYEEGRVRLRTVVLRRGDDGFVTETPGDDWVFTPPAFVTVPRGEMYGKPLGNRGDDRDTVPYELHKDPIDPMPALLGANLAAELARPATEGATQERGAAPAQPPAPDPSPMPPRAEPLLHAMARDPQRVPATPPPAHHSIPAQSQPPAATRVTADPTSEPIQGPKAKPQPRPMTLDEVAETVAAQLEGSEIGIVPAMQELKLTGRYSTEDVLDRLMSPPYKLRRCRECQAWFSSPEGERVCLSCR